MSALASLRLRLRAQTAELASCTTGAQRQCVAGSIAATERQIAKAIVPSTDLANCTTNEALAALGLTKRSRHPDNVNATFDIVDGDAVLFTGRAHDTHAWLDSLAAACALAIVYESLDAFEQLDEASRAWLVRRGYFDIVRGIGGSKTLAVTEHASDMFAPAWQALEAERCAS